MSYPDLAAFKTHMTTTTTGEDTVLQAALDAAIDEVENYCGRVFVAASATREFPVEQPYIDNRRLVLTLYEDLTAVTSITNGDGIAVSSDDYRLVPPQGAPYHQIVLDPYSTVRWVTTGSKIAIEGDWGYAVNCPARIYFAILQVAAYLYRNKMAGGVARFSTVQQGGRVSEGTALPESVLMTLDRFRRVSI